MNVDVEHTVNPRHRLRRSGAFGIDGNRRVARLFRLEEAMNRIKLVHTVQTGGAI